VIPVIEPPVIFTFVEKSATLATAEITHTEVNVTVDPVELSMRVVRASVVPDAVYVPMNNSHAEPSTARNVEVSAFESPVGDAVVKASNPVTAALSVKSPEPPLATEVTLIFALFKSR
jgi:hypothetical protein